MKNKWSTFIQEFTFLVQAYLLLVFMQSIFRIIMILWFYKNISPLTDFHNIILTLAHGFRFDSKISSAFILVPFLSLILIPLNFKILFSPLRTFFTMLGIVTITLSSIVTLPYFKEFGNQFNFFIFEAFYDDGLAVLKTALLEHYLIINILIVVFISWCMWSLIKNNQLHIQKFSEYKFFNPNSLSKRSLIIILIIVSFSGAIRGSFKSRPAIRKWSDITSDNFLNKTIMNPLTHLQYAIQDFRKINKKKNVEQFFGNLKPSSAAQEYFGVRKDSLLSNYLEQTVAGNNNKLPKHIFFIIMESYDMWPLLPQYRSLGLAKNLHSLADRGMFFNRFLPSGESTMASVSSILTGIPYTGVNISRIASTKASFPTSIPYIFEQFGYKTRLYYGGFLSWQNIGNLFEGQGFDEVHGSPQIEKNNSNIVWGVDDDQLFTYIENQNRDDIKSFNVILTTSYHPPYNIDLEKYGFPLKEIPSDLKSQFDESMTMRQLGHIWYSDWAIGNFVKNIEKRYPESLFIFTGDHYGRRFINAHPTLYERSAVPLILYGQNFIEPQLNKISTPGSHIDITPTLVSLIAPYKFEYQSFGNPLINNFDLDIISSEKKFGFGYKRIILKNHVIDSKNKSIEQIFISNDQNMIDEQILSIIKKQKILHGLSWWRIFKGDNL